MSSIRLNRLTKRYGASIALDALSLDIEGGKMTVLLGPSGCGKSTCLRLIAGLEQADEGQIMIDGLDVSTRSPAERGIAMVFQSYALFPHLTVADNIIFGLRVRNMAKVERETKLIHVAKLVGLTDYLERRPSQLSGGQRQRVALARAIVSERPVCLMDEPLSNLDAQLRHEMRVEIRALQQRLGMTMIYVTHDQTEAMAMADSIVLMREGRIEQVGSPANLYNDPASAFVARFIGAPSMNLITSAKGGHKRGVRPEHVVLGLVEHPKDFVTHATVLKGIIETVEYLGAETVITVRVGEYVISSRMAGMQNFYSGQSVFAHWEKTNEFAFDALTERRILRAPPTHP